MMDRTMDLFRYDVIDVADIDSYDGPDADVSGTQTVVTVICGRVSGELDRVVSRDEDCRLRPDTLIITFLGHVIFGVLVGLAFVRISGRGLTWPWPSALSQLESRRGRQGLKTPFFNRGAVGR